MAIVYDDEMVDDLDSFDTNSIYDINIKVFGVGGGGCNAIEHMAKGGVNGVEYIAVNTDVPALRAKDKNLMRRIQIGKKATRGRGAGGRPEVAAESANEDKDDIIKQLKDATMVFISAGMGGGTGTGAAPVIASLAQELGILTVGVVTKPFEFEREYKMNQALKGIAEMRKHVDALVIVPNQKLFDVNERAINIRQAFAMVDDVLLKVVKSIANSLNQTAVTNIDFSDLKSTLEKAGDAHIAIGVGTGDNKVDEVVAQIINSPLLETSINNAGKILVNIIISEDVTLNDVDDVMNRITSAGRPGVQVIYGLDYNYEVKDTMEVTIIATCFENTETGEELTFEKAVEAKRASEKTAPDPIETTKSGSLDQFITQNISDVGDDDPFKELESIFKSR